MRLPQPLLIGTLLALLLVLLCSPATASSWDEEIVARLASGDQVGVEEYVAKELRQNPSDVDLRFWSGVLLRNRFYIKPATPHFLHTLVHQPNSVIGQASACILGIDHAADAHSALHYFNALLLLASQNPRSVPVRWMAAVMSRTVTNDEFYQIEGERRTRIILSGIRECEAVLRLLSPGQGSSGVYHTMGNLLDELDAFERAAEARLVTVRLERKSWSLHAAAYSLSKAGRNEEALPLAQEALRIRPKEFAYQRTLGNILWELGRRTEALAAWEAAIQIDPSSGSTYRAAVRGYRKLGNTNAARALTQRWLKANPNDRLFKIWDARLAVIQGESGAAQRLFEVGEFKFDGEFAKMEPIEGEWFRAVQTGDLTNVRRLIQNGSDVNAAEPKYQQTALMLAAKYGWEAIAVELLRAKADLTLVDANKSTALHYAATFDQPRILRLLLDAGAPLNMQDRWRQTPLINCASGGDWDALTLLIERGADVNIATPHGGTPLHYASGWGRLDMVLKLLAKGADKEVRASKIQRTPLIAACNQHGPHAAVVVALVEAGANINAQDKEGRTALHHIIDPLMNRPLVDFLLQSSADPTIPDATGVTPITQARLLGFEELALAMEQKVGKSEPLAFPKFDFSGGGQSRALKNAAVFMMPLLLAQGHPLGRPSAVPPGDAQAARRELRRMFDISNAQQLQAEVQALTDFQPRPRMEAIELSPTIKQEQLRQLLIAVPGKVREPLFVNEHRELAWVQTHLIYLADLGLTAGYITPDEGNERIERASQKLAAAFASWQEFFESFNAGARFHNGWEAQRYEHIGNILKKQPIIWPASSPS